MRISSNKKDSNKYEIIKRCSVCKTTNINPTLTENKFVNGRIRKLYLCDKCDMVEE
jgi:hypothetical protein